VKTKDLFAGCMVTIASDYGDGWLVAVGESKDETIALKHFADLPETMEAAHHWVFMLGDASEIPTDEPVSREAAQFMRTTLAWLAIGEEPPTKPLRDDELLTWFEREMRKSRRGAERTMDQQDGR
jgi:hypothetical protein